MLLCEFIMNSTRSPPAEEALYLTLLQLYLAGDTETSRDESVPSTSPAARRQVQTFLWQPSGRWRQD